MPVLDFEPQVERPVSGMPGHGFCREHNRLLNLFAEAVDELLLLHESRFRAVVKGSPDSKIIDSLIEHARVRKDNAKRDYVEHTQRHGCASL